MHPNWMSKCVLAVLLLGTGAVWGQDLTPRAYIITPLHSNAITLGFGFYDGSLLFPGTIPITGATTRLNVPVAGLFHSFDFFGRTANFIANLPYGVGDFHGTVLGAEASARRSGLLAASFRLSVNLVGGPAMDVAEFSRWRQKTIVGVSITVVPPSGQYDPTKLINFGTNRWAVEPEVGYSRRWGDWLLDGYGGVWFYSTNPEFFSNNQFVAGTHIQSENPVGALQAHLSRDFKPRLWVSLDANFWTGGATSVDHVPSPGTLQRNSRVGVTVSVPLTKHQSFKASYSQGAYIQYGGDYKHLSLGWQYSWLGRPN